MGNRRNAWLTPDDTSPIVWSGRCLNIPEPLYPSVIGALSLLTEVWRWEQFGTMTPDDAAQIATVMLEGFVGDGCSDMDCESVIQCLLDSGLLGSTTPDGDIRVDSGVPQVSYDAGVTWQDIAGDPNADPYVPAPVATPGATDEIRKCLAATRAALVLNEVYQGVYGAVAADIHNAANAFSNWLGNAMNDILIMIYGEAAGVLNSEILRGYSLPTNYTAAELTPSQLDDLVCLLLLYATDNPAGIVTFNWEAIRDNMITTMGINPGTALWSIVVYLKNRGIERASQVNITSVGACAPCGAAWNECSFNGAGLRIWTQSSARVWSSLALVNGSYDAGNDKWLGAYQGRVGGTGPYYFGAVIDIPLTTQTITRIEADGFVDPVNFNAGASGTFSIVGYLSGAIVFEYGVTGSGTKSIVWNGSEVLDRIDIVSRGANTNGAAYETSITSVCVYGEGVNPF